jgi:hypothetical protein
VEASALSRASALCLARRVRAAVVAAPAPALAAAALLAASPLLLYRAGGALADALGAQLADVQVARALLLALCLAGGIVGVMLGLVVPPRSAIGAQLSAAPVGPLSVAAALTLVPLGLAGLAAAPLLLAFSLPIAAAAPGGVASIGSTVGAAVGAIAVGLLAAETVRSALRRDAGAAAAIAAIALAWAGSRLVGAPAALGPLGVAADALAGIRSVPVALVVELSVILCALAGWCALVTRGAPRASSRAPRVLLPTPVGTRAAVAVAALRLLLRRSDVQLTLGAGVLFGLSTTALGGAADGARLGLAGSSVALAAAIVPLAATGILLEGRLLWRSAPVRPGAVAALWSGVAVVLPTVVTGGVVLVVLAAAGGASDDASRVVFVAALTAAAALAGGAVVPWRGSRLGDQLASFAAFAVCAGAVSIGGGVLAARVVSYGLPELVVACALLATTGAVGALGVAARLRGAAR